ncbi:hypothetical protein D3C73_1570360 [compost metagenome]
MGKGGLYNFKIQPLIRHLHRRLLAELQADDGGVHVRLWDKHGMGNNGNHLGLAVVLYGNA